MPSLRDIKTSGARLIEPGPADAEKVVSGGVEQPPQNKHTARRLGTRSNLIGAARQLVRLGRGTKFSVDEVCQLANVSRAGFYLHFASKTELLDALQQEMSEWYVRQFCKLDRAASASKDGLYEWLLGFAKGFEAVKLAALLAAFREDQTPGIGARTRGEAILAIGGRVPAFRMVRHDGSIDEERRIGLLLLVFQIEQLCLYLVFDKPANREMHLRILARQILAFMTSEVT